MRQFNVLARRVLVRLLALVLRPFAAGGSGALRAAVPGPPRRILVIKPDHLGDVILLTPALAALRQAYPRARISVLVGPWARRLLQDNPAIDELLTCPFPGFVRDAAPSFWRPYAALFRYAALLRAGCFDAAIIARDDHWWGGLLALAAGIGRRVGYAHPLLLPTLTAGLPWDADAHVSRQALDLVAALGAGAASDPAPTTSFYPTAAERRWADDWVARHSPGRPLIAIQPGSGGAAKLWPPAEWAAVAAALADAGTLVLTGGPADAADVAAIHGVLAAPHLTLVGEAGLGQLAALFGRCALVLGVDNGPLHLAVSQGAPTIHLFGPGDHGRFGPWGDPGRHVVLRAGLWCSPCGVLTHCPRRTSPSECMAAIPAAQVIAAARRLLAGND